MAEQHPSQIEFWYLPYKIAKQDVYECFVDDLKETLFADMIPSKQTFLYVWKKHFNWLKIPHHVILGGCDDCIHYANLMEREQNNLENLAEIKQQRKNQLDLVAAERKELAQRYLMTKNYPSQIMSVTIDYRNPDKLPHQKKCLKSWINKRRPKLEAYGIINFGIDEWFYHVHMPFYKHDANLSISILFHHLRDLRDNGRCPPILYINSDNCYKDNKNQYLFQFYAWLIYLGWFTEIHHYYLPRGHSHEKVDGLLFAPLGSARFKYNYSTPNEFVNHYIPSTFSNNREHTPYVLDLPLIFDFKTYFEDFSISGLTHHSKYRAFKFSKDLNNNTPVMWYKENALKMFWLGLNGDINIPIQLLQKEKLNLLDINNLSVPQVILPTPLSEEELTDIPTLLSSNIMSDEAIEWWNNFL